MWFFYAHTRVHAHKEFQATGISRITRGESIAPCREAFRSPIRAMPARTAQCGGRGPQRQPGAPLAARQECVANSVGSVTATFVCLLYIDVEFAAGRPRGTSAGLSGAVALVPIGDAGSCVCIAETARRTGHALVHRQWDNGARVQRVIISPRCRYRLQG